MAMRGIRFRHCGICGVDLEGKYGKFTSKNKYCLHHLEREIDDHEWKHIKYGK